MIGGLGFFPISTETPPQGSSAWQRTQRPPPLGSWECSMHSVSCPSQLQCSRPDLSQVQRGGGYGFWMQTNDVDQSIYVLRSTMNRSHQIRSVMIDGSRVLCLRRVWENVGKQRLRGSTLCLFHWNVRNWKGSTRQFRNGKLVGSAAHPRLLLPAFLCGRVQLRYIDAPLLYRPTV